MPQIIKMLMGLGQMKTATQSLSDEEVELIAAELEREVTIKHAGEEEAEPESYDDAEEALEARPPVVTIMGHVDHGKTTLLDAIRETAVVETEAGGITQHIGAYQTEVDGRKITFLDTPGHEAFTAMRARGAKVTDIAVLVVAADDGVMPQTKESISHARAADVPIVVAVNKIDLPDANPDRVLAELATEGLQPEEWGGTTQVARVSAKQREGLDDLLEQILLVADAELDPEGEPERRRRPGRSSSRASTSAAARSRRCSSTAARSRSATRSSPATRGAACARSTTTAASGSRARARATRSRSSASTSRRRPARWRAWSRTTAAPASSPTSAASGCAARRSRSSRAAASRSRSCSSRCRPARVQDLNIVLKADVQGSIEAIVGELAKIQHPEVRVNVIHTGVGGITENDVNLAAASNAMVVGFNVRPSSEARQLAERQGIEIRQYRVIYELTQQIEQALVGMLSPVETEAVIGEVEVRALFSVSRLGTIAGCMVTSGLVRRNVERPPLPRRHAHPRDDDRPAQALQGRRARGGRGLRVRHPARGLQRPPRRRHLRGLRDARGRADVARQRPSRVAPPAAGDVLAERARTATRCAGFVAILVGRAPLPGGGLAQGQAQVRARRRRRSSRTASARRWPRSTTTSSGSAAR